jgi:predicted acylesterase/phospholipase RssA
VTPADHPAELEAARAAWRARMREAGAEAVWEKFGGRIAAVLSGGGARGSYEAGALLAFQDARLPTHILTSTSIGSINAAAYAAHSRTLVGDAEKLIQTWYDLTPQAAGIEWTRYVLVLGGLVAASAGFGNLIVYLLATRGITYSLHDPALTWLGLGLAGLAVLLLYDSLPYIGYVVRNTFRKTSWQPDRRKLAWSVVANLLVWSVAALVIHSLQLTWAQLGWMAAALAVLAGVYFATRGPLGKLLHWLLRQPLRPGLFANFERGRLLRQLIPAEGLKASPIRAVFTATDLETGAARFFTNADPAALAAEPGVDAKFVSEEMATADDLVRAVVASSALPIAYEPITLGGRTYADGGIVANQPIRPAIRLGAEVLFLITMDSPDNRRGQLDTFVDVGLRALDILMLQNLLTDLKVLSNINAVCAHAAAELGVRPEEVEIDLGTRRYRHIQAFTIAPRQPLGGTVLDFGGGTTVPAALAGYRDACEQIEKFLAFARQARFGAARRVLRFAAERDVLKPKST